MSGNLQDFTLRKKTFSRKFRGPKKSVFSSYSFEICSSDSRNSFSRSSSIGSDPGIMEIPWFLNPTYDHSRFTLGVVFSYFFTSGAWIFAFLTSDSDSSSKTVCIASWRGPKSWHWPLSVYPFPVNFGVLKIQLFQLIPSNFTHPITKTASPGPAASVPTQGSWKFDDLLWQMLKAKSLSVYPSGSVFPIFSPLELGFLHFWAQIRIPHEKLYI